MRASSRVSPWAETDAVRRCVMAYAHAASPGRAGDGMCLIAGRTALLWPRRCRAAGQGLLHWRSNPQLDAWMRWALQKRPFTLSSC